LEDQVSLEGAIGFRS